MLVAQAELPREPTIEEFLLIPPEEFADSKLEAEVPGTALKLSMAEAKMMRDVVQFRQKMGMNGPWESPLWKQAKTQKH